MWCPKKGWDSTVNSDNLWSREQGQSFLLPGTVKGQILKIKFYRQTGFNIQRELESLTQFLKVENSAHTLILCLGIVFAIEMPNQLSRIWEKSLKFILH